MHEEHPIFAAPSDPDIAIWRYMDLPKLVSMFARRALWFARADTLGDAHEGAYGSFNVSMRAALYTDIPPDRLNQISEFTRQTVRRTYVNCWHMAEVESVAMWRVYAPLGQGVAVRSTYRRLTENLLCSDPVYIGVVRYVDPAAEWIPEGNMMWPFLHKRLSFDYERELRAVVPTFPQTDGKIDVSLETVPGLALEVDLGQLVESIYVAPDQPGWFCEAVEQVTNRIGPGNIPLRKSDLDADPLY